MEPYSSDDIKRKKRKPIGVIPEVKTAIIVSAGGLPIASELSQGVDKTKMAAMIAALFSLSKKTLINSLSKNHLE